MKLFLFIFGLCVSQVLVAQTGSIKLKLEYTDSSIIDQPVFVQLFKGSKSVYYGYYHAGFSIDSLSSASYRLSFNRLGESPYIVDTILVRDGESIVIQSVYPFPCQYQYKKGAKPVCLNGHKNRIIPIVYGFPNKGLMKKAKQNKVRLGGCEVTGCDPKYYCTIHETEL